MKALLYLHCFTCLTYFLRTQASFVGLDFTLGRMWEVRSESVERLAIAVIDIFIPPLPTALLGYTTAYN